MVCTFFGHQDAPRTILLELEKTIEYLIAEKQVKIFYVGNHGNFDAMVKITLIKMKKKYPYILTFVVLAYLPNTRTQEIFDIDTIYPEGLETVPPRFAIDKRNRWMIKQADYAVTYVKYSVGGASKYKTVAEKAGKTVIELA